MLLYGLTYDYYSKLLSKVGAIVNSAQSFNLMWHRHTKGRQGKTRSEVTPTLFHFPNNKKMNKLFKESTMKVRYSCLLLNKLSPQEKHRECPFFTNLRKENNEV